MLDYLHKQPGPVVVHLLRKILTDPALKSSTLLAMSTVISGALAYVYNAYAARLLGPSEYSLLGVAMSLYFILAIALTPLANVIAKLVAECKANGQDGQIAFLVSTFTRKMFMYGMPVFLLMIVASNTLNRFLNIDSPVPVILIGGLFWSNLLLVTIRGILQGLQQFRDMAFSQVAEALLRLLSGIFLLTVGLGANGAISAFIFASSLSFIGLLMLLRRQYQIPSTPIHLPLFSRYSSSALILTLCFTLAQNMDIILVKRYFPAEQAGLYVAVTLIGKVLSLFSAPFYQVMFPQVTKAQAHSQKTTAILVKTLSLIGFICSLFIFGSWLSGSLITSVSFGAAYTASAGLLWLYSVATTLLILVGTIAYYKLALADTSFEIPLLGGICLEFVLLILFHKSLTQVIQMIILANGTMLIAMLIVVTKGAINTRLAKKITPNNLSSD